MKILRPEVIACLRGGESLMDVINNLMLWPTIAQKHLPKDTIKLEKKLIFIRIKPGKCQ